MSMPDRFQEILNLVGDAALLAELTDPATRVPVNPRAADFYARGTESVQYSGQVVPVPLLAAAFGADITDNAQNFTPLFGLRGSQGVARTWHVRVTQEGTPDQANFRAPGIFVRVRWVIGTQSDFADIELRTGAACFALTCEGMTVEGVFAPNQLFLPPFNIPTAMPMRVAVSPYPLPGDYRAPTFTNFMLVGLGNQNFPVPRNAQQVSFFGVGSFGIDFQTTNGTVIATYIQNANGGELVDVPAGAALCQLRFGGVPGEFITGVFRLGL